MQARQDQIRNYPEYKQYIEWSSNDTFLQKQRKGTGKPLKSQKVWFYKKVWKTKIFTILFKKDNTQNEDWPSKDVQKEQTLPQLY